jgi:hypothetical protein
MCALQAWCQPVEGSPAINPQQQAGAEQQQPTSLAPVVMPELQQPPALLHSTYTVSPICTRDTAHAELEHMNEW